MFKKIYKEINNSIPVNEELLSSLLEEAQKPVKRVKFTRFYRYGSVVAAALILTVSAIAVSKIGIPVTEARPVKSDTATISDQITETQADEPIKESSATQFDAYNVKQEDSLTEEKSLARARGISQETDIDEYSADLEADLSNIALPDGVIRLSETVPYEFDEAGNDTVIVYSNGHKTLNLTITANTEYVAEMLELHPNNRVYGNDGYISAYVLKENSGYIVDCCNFTESEVEFLINSLK